MSNNSFIINQLNAYFRESPTFTREKLYDFYQQFEPHLKRSTFASRIHDLKRKKVIGVVKKKVYSMSPKPTFSPLFDKKLQKIYRFINDTLIGSSEVYN